jgi:aminoglycoside 6'-N-acetyltransferase I
MHLCQIWQFQLSDRDALAKMRALLWPQSKLEDHRKEFDALLKGTATTLPLTIFVSCDEMGMLTGFIEVDLRSHADGCDPTRPVGYIEGWFVHEAYRKKGVGAVLMRAAEEWSRSHGCHEIASDALIDNEPSQHAHASLGFEVVDRCVHFRKAL